MALFVHMLLAGHLSVFGGPIDAEEIYQRGVVSYQTHDYDAAIETFTEAFELAKQLEDEVKRERVLAGLRFNLARAHLRKFEIDGDESRLRIARRLVADYRAALLSAGKDPDADEHVADIEAELAVAEASVAKAPPSTIIGSTAPLASGVGDPIAEASSLPVSEKARARPATHSMRTWGQVSLGLAAPGLAVGLAGSVLARRAERDFGESSSAEGRVAAQAKGDRADRMMIGGFTTAGVLIGVGVGLWVGDHLRHREKRVTFSGRVYRSGATLSFHGRF